MHACTAVTRTHVAHARVLARSFLEYHAGVSFTVLVADDPHGDFRRSGEPFTTVQPDEIGLERRELHRMAAMYTPRGLANACQSLLMQHLCGGSDEPVVQFDADMRVYGPLDDVAELASVSGVVLSPHTTVPAAGPDGLEIERRLLRAGAYNAGLIGAGAKARGFLDWMAGRVRRHCIIDPSVGFHHRQRWLDLVPSLFPHYILCDRGLNAMGWNLHDADVIDRGGRLEVAGAPLRLFHFCGEFDPERPDMLTTLPGLPWASLSERPGVARLAAKYAGELLADGYTDARSAGYAFGHLQDGTPIDPPMRVAYRQALLDAEAAGRDEPPNPFEPGEALAFADWLREPVAGCPRYLRALWALRLDLQAAFPDVLRGRVAAYLDWARESAGDAAPFLSR